MENSTPSTLLVLIVHGGNAHHRVDDGIEQRTLVKNTFSLDKGTPSFGEVLDKYLQSPLLTVANPRFPHAHDACYTEWRRFFWQVLNDPTYSSFSEIILIGHSLGTTFLQRCLTEDLSLLGNRRIRQIHFVGSCLEEGNFCVSENWEVLSQHPSEKFIYHSLDDDICPFSWGQTFHKKLAPATFFAYRDCGHFEVPRIYALEKAIREMVLS